MLEEVIDYIYKSEHRSPRKECPLNFGEQIKDIEGYEGLYQVTNHGRVWGVKSRKWLRLVPYSTDGKYLKVNLCKNGVATNCDVHMLVIRAFKPKPELMYEMYRECRHLDDNGHNNHIDNLEWGTRSQNYEDRVRNGTGNEGERNAQAKITEQDVIDIRQQYAEGKSVTELLKIYPLARNNIWKILNRQSWAHVQ